MSTFASERRRRNMSNGGSPFGSRPRDTVAPPQHGSRFVGDFSAIPAHRDAEEERWSFGAKYRSGPRRDDARLRIAAVPDVVLATFQSRTVDVHVNDANVTSIEWHLQAPDGSVVPGSRVGTKPGDADATSRPFQLQKSHLGDFGRFHLHCSGIGANGNPIVHAVRDFNAVSVPMTEGVGRHGKRGMFVFREYQEFQSPAGRPWLKVVLAFLPNEGVKCDDVLFIQTAQPMAPDGSPLHRTVSDIVEARADQSGWVVDQDEETTSPYYIVNRDRVTGKQEPKSAQGTVGRGGPKPGEAALIDRPNTNRDMVTHFETCAVCRSGKNRGEVYGCATWGFVIDGGGTITKMPADTTEEPSQEFRAANQAWNVWVAGKPDAELTP